MKIGNRRQITVKKTQVVVLSLETNDLENSISSPGPSEIDSSRT